LLLTKYDMALEDDNNADHGSWKFSTARSCLVIRDMVNDIFHCMAVECSDIWGIVHGSVVE
jgi:hypothetical protein